MDLNGEAYIVLRSASQLDRKKVDSLAIPALWENLSCCGMLLAAAPPGTMAVTPILLDALADQILQQTPVGYHHHRQFKYRLVPLMVYGQVLYNFLA